MPIQAGEELYLTHHAISLAGDGIKEGIYPVLTEISPESPAFPFLGFRFNFPHFY